MRTELARTTTALLCLAALAWTATAAADTLPAGATQPDSQLVVQPTVTPEGGVGSGGLVLTADVLHALVEVHNSGGTGNPAVLEPMKALLFKNNRAINRARLLGWISDDLYQTAQGEFARLNEAFASESAREAGADFTKQVSKSKCFQPGTDSDYITKVRSPEQIKAMQAAYNRRINAYLAQNGIADAQTSWEEMLDTDFMGDPAYVNDVQFNAIGELNNDAYRRRLAAEYERVSRAKTTVAGKALPQEITPELVREYTDEMLDFIKKKQDKIAHFNHDLQAAADPALEADLYRSMMQEQKYIDRINGANDAIRGQSGLGPMRHGLTSRDGFRFSQTPSTEPPVSVVDPAISELGAKRGPQYIGTAISASSVAENSIERALSQLAETYADAAAKNSRFAVTAPGDIARITQSLSAAQKGALIERIRLVGGDSLAARTASAMRSAGTAADAAAAKAAVETAKRDARSGPPAEAGGLTELMRPFDEAMQKALGISGDLSKAGLTRRQFNQLAANWMPRLNAALNLYFIGKETVESSANFRDYVFNITAAMDPNTPDAVAQQHLAAAQQLAVGMGLKGTIGAGMLGLMQAFPTAGAMIGSFAVSYQGGRWLLENTKTGQAFDRAAGGAFDAAISGGESLSDMLTGWTGGETRAMRVRRERTELLTAYSKAFQRGQIRLAAGVELGDLVEAVMRGDPPNAIQKLLAAKCGCPARVRFAREPFDPSIARPKSCPVSRLVEAQGEWEAACDGMAKTLPSPGSPPMSKADEEAAEAMKSLGRGTDAIQVRFSTGGPLTLKLDETAGKASMRLENDAAHGGDGFVMVPGLRPAMMGIDELQASLTGGEIVQSDAKPAAGRAGAATIKIELKGAVVVSGEGEAPRTVTGEGTLAFDVHEGGYFCGCSGKFWVPSKP